MVADTLGDCRLHCKLHFFTFEKCSSLWLWMCCRKVDHYLLTLDNSMRKILEIMRGRNNQKKPLCLRQYQGQEIDLTPANGISITHTR